MDQFSNKTWLLFYVPNREMINYKCVPPKVFARYFTRAVCEIGNCMKLEQSGDICQLISVN